MSADIGGGHHATGRALQERVQELWPSSQVRWVDTLDAMGPGVGRVFRRTYVTNVEVTPWLYEFFYASLWRHRWLADASKRFVGAWAGRRLKPVVEAFDPDLILSTYPLGSAGLAWLRERRGLGVPFGAWVSDFAPHPFWVYPQVDLNLLMHPAALPLAAAAAPGAAVAVCAPPVLSGFHPGDRAEARERGRIVSVDPGEQLTGRIMGWRSVLRPGTRRTEHDRLLLKVAMRSSRVVAVGLSIGDLVMARRQLLNFKHLAEQGTE